MLINAQHHGIKVLIYWFWFLYPGHRPIMPGGLLLSFTLVFSAVFPYVDKCTEYATECLRNVADR